MLNNQLELAQTVRSSTQFSSVVRQRLLVLERIFYAVNKKYHDKEQVGISLCLKIILNHDNDIIPFTIVDEE